MVVAKKKTNKVGSVMVAGAGIAGMQAALDLANSGFKVYLSDEGDSIGGRMAQLDKTFPTNDCAMCTISPRLIEVDKHPNIEILTRTQIVALNGEPGRFRVRLNRNPRYVDLELCNACGDCIEVCPVSVDNPYEYGLASRKAIFKTYPQAIPNTFAIEKADRAPCGSTCPAGINCQGYIALVAEGKFAEAAKLIFERNPFLSVCGRVCHHPCENECHRGAYDEAVAINPIKRFLGDWAIQHPEQMREVFQRQQVEDEEIRIRRKKNSAHKVAVVGSGPAGLSAALDLARLGYQVTVFEAASTPGGMLQTGFPDYRLPKDIVQKEIKRILDFGIELRLNTTIGDDVSLSELKRNGYKAIFSAIGLQTGKVLDIEGAELAGVLNGLEFLERVIRKETVEIGDNVIVIGGGNVAIDSAQTAVRLGAKRVMILYRRTRQEMPAHSWQIEEALAEGVELRESFSPVRVLGNGKVAALRASRSISVSDDTGRTQLELDESTTEDISCDTLIFAVGQGIDRDVVDMLGLELSERGTLKVDRTTLATNVEGVFAGGDAIEVNSSVVEAVGTGHEASISIDRYIHGQDLKEGRDKLKQTAPKPEKVVETLARIQEPQIALETLQNKFAETTAPITAEQAIAEAKRCLNCGICSECQQCFYTCEPKAIFHDRQPTVEELEIGALILAPGFEPFDARKKPEFGYGRYPNVITAPEFERILSASGPYDGQIRRPSDGKTPRRIAWIQCVGSRDRSCGREYCSSVCCMYTTKQAIVAREHEGDALEATIFYNDIRAFGKGFERYYDRARNELNVLYVKCLVSSVKQFTRTNNLLVKYIDDTERVTEEEFDLVVLSVGLVPNRSSERIFKTLDIAVNTYGFCESDELLPASTNREGVFVCGAGESPKDIPEAVVQASCAAALAGEILKGVRGALVSPKTYPLERTVAEEEPRVGVFVCHCGSNIARVIDVEELTGFTEQLPHVVHAERNLYTCSTDAQAKIVETIQEKGINRVVVSSCTPRTHESLFQDTIREAGLNRYLFEMANIRDQCSWVHSDTPELALEKAKDLVAMAVRRAATLEPLEEMEYEITKNALVIGGGAAGMTAALSIADQGFDVCIVEKTDQLGGNLGKLKRLLDGRETAPVLRNLVTRVNAHSRIRVLTGAQIVDFNGHVGEFNTRVRIDGQECSIDHGVVVFATGATEYRPQEYLCPTNRNVLTQLDLEELVAENPETVKEMRSVVMIQCVGSREEPQNYCSRICCQEAVKNALLLKEINPELKVYVLYRDIRTYGFSELFYLQARERGVIFMRFDPDDKPSVEQTEEGLQVKVTATSLAKTFTIAADRVILSAGIRTEEALEELLQKFKVPVNEDGFFFEAHMKLRPLDFANEGMFMAGFAHAPKLLGETIAQAKAAAARAVTVLSKDKLLISGSVAIVDEDRCAICLTCVRLCPYEVPKINENNRAYIDAASCQGCGVCAVACPARAIEVRHYKDEQILAKCDAIDLRKELEHAARK